MADTKNIIADESNIHLTDAQERYIVKYGAWWWIKNPKDERMLSGPFSDLEYTVNFFNRYTLPVIEQMG